MIKFSRFSGFGIAATIVAISPASATLKHGFNIGIGAACMVGNHNAKFFTQPDGGVPPASWDKFQFGKTQAGGDVLIGYGFVYNNYYLGIETDYLFGNISRTNKKNAGGGAGFEDTINVDAKGGAWGVGLRMGYQCNRTTPFLRVGYERRKFKIRYQNLASDQNANPILVTVISGSHNKDAVTVGGGMDFNITPKNVVLGLEYRYSIYSKMTNKGRNNIAEYNLVSKIKPSISTFLLSLKYQFCL